MKEQLLQFIWRFQYFNHQQLHTETGETLQIISPGDINTHQGPDFLNAGIRIGDTSWIGNIELHIHTSDWRKHAHQDDKNYRNVILHVVWENDLPTVDDLPTAADVAELAAGRNIPLLVLQHRIPKLLLGKYEEWMNHRSFVACERQLPQAGEKTWSDWKRQLLEERLHRRALFIQGCLEQNNQHWEETVWWLLARNFGLPVNTASFEAIARSLPLRVLARHRNRVDQLEALLLGQAGLLEKDFREDYPLSLQKEFHYLRKKYRLPAIHPSVLFLRMRPGNFPAIRLAQLAGLLSLSTSWFARMKEADSPRELKKMMAVETSPYWDDHYVLGKRSLSGSKVGHPPFMAAEDNLRSRSGPRRLGEQMKESILINTCSPLLFAYGRLRKEKAFLDKALRWLTEIPAEKNALVAGWDRQGIYSKNAADTQALLELKAHYCDPKKCLECAVGNFLLSPPSAPRTRWK
jgi:hypothetical protein